MKKIEKLKPIEAAYQFINKHFPHCHGALLAGSVVRGEHTQTSDLDIVVFDKHLIESYRESFIEFGWPVEVFVHNLSSYKRFFKIDTDRGRPSLPRMVSEGLILKDTEILDSIKREANEILIQGPEPWSLETMATKRYFISDALTDFKGSEKRAEDLFIANTLAELTSEFVLRSNGRWVGSSKWIHRTLVEYDNEFAARFVEAFDTFYKFGNKDQIVQLVEEVLQPHGGLLFEGFSLGKG